MRKVLEDVTLETVSDALRKEGIHPGEHFSIVVEEPKSRRPRLADIAAQMRATAISRGLTAEIFDVLLSEPE